MSIYDKIVSKRGFGGKYWVKEEQDGGENKKNSLKWCSIEKKYRCDDRIDGKAL
jgi:hypothetical protein